jgi:hypothetical protein
MAEKRPYPKNAVAMVTDFQHKSSAIAMFRRALSMCPINFVFMLCKVKKQAFSGYYSAV